MALPDDIADSFHGLWRALNRARPSLIRLDRYYEGQRRLEKLGLAVPPELEHLTTVVNWPRIGADSVEQRCDVEGFRLPGAETADDELWDVWQHNDLDDESQMGHLDSIVTGCVYVQVGTREEDEPEPNVPLITVESALDMIHEVGKGRAVAAALRRTSRTEATLYLPHATHWMENGRRGWTEVDRDEHDLGVVPVVPLANRPRLKNRHGVSEIGDVISLTDAACRALTNAQVATEVLAVPQRFVLGASPKDFVDEQGKPVPAWETYFGAVWALLNKDAKVGQFSAADLSNFKTIVEHYAGLVSSQAGVPARYLGLTTANPPSEGSIVSDEVRLIMRARRVHRAVGGGWERTMRLARRIMDGDWDPKLTRMETLWANPETPTMAQRADAVVKLVQAKGSPDSLLPVEAAWEELGYSATKRAILRRMRDQAMNEDPLIRAADAFRTSTGGADPNVDPAGAAAGAVDGVDPAAVPAFDPAAGGVRG